MGVKAIPNSVKLWMQAAKLEQDDITKSTVLRKGLEYIPDSATLWIAVVNRAVECCPLRLDLWLVLAKMETYDNAKKVLNMAKEKLPKEHAIWVADAQLEEASGNAGMVETLIETGIQSLERESVVIDRGLWITHAEAVERAGSFTTCQTIIHYTLGIGVEDIDRKRTRVTDAEGCEKRGSIETAKTIYAHALTVFFNQMSIWLKAGRLEKSNGTVQSLDDHLRKAVTYLPQEEVLWLMGAKEKWLAGDVPAAREILEEAYAPIPYKVLVRGSEVANKHYLACNMDNNHQFAKGVID